MGKRRCITFLAAAVGFALVIPGSAVAQVPPVDLPPEVTDAVGEVLAQLPNPLVPAIDGVGGAAVTPGHAEASVVEIDGVVTLGKSESDKTGSKVTILNVGGTDVLVRDGDANGGTYSGEAAALGDGIDQVNEALCPGGPPAANAEPKACVLLLYSTAKTRQGSIRTNSASFRAVSIYSPAGPESLTVGSTSASTSVVFTRCIDVATSFLISGGGQLAALFLVNPGGPLAGVKASVLQPC